MIKEVIRFRLGLGPQTDEFLSRYREVRTAMTALGVEPGIAWTTVAGRRQLIVEREFDTLASYEADDAAFHGGEEFIALWRKLESTAESMEAEIWKTSATRDDLDAVRARRT